MHLMISIVVLVIGLTVFNYFFNRSNRSGVRPYKIQNLLPTNQVMEVYRDGYAISADRDRYYVWFINTEPNNPRAELIASQKVKNGHLFHCSLRRGKIFVVTRRPFSSEYDTMKVLDVIPEIFSGKSGGNKDGAN